MSRRVAGLFGLFVAVVAALAAHAARYYPFFSDDALITLRYARRLCSGQGLTWTDGPRVEGYTDLLWVLVNAPATCLGADPMWSARVLDFIGATVAIWVVALPRGPSRVPVPERLAGGGVALASAAPIAVWSIGGLEHGFMFGLIALALRFSVSASTPREVIWASAFFGLLAISRADGIVLFVAATAAWLVYRPTPARDLGALLRWCAFPVGFYAAQLGFRLVYYGEWVPNTALAKVSFSFHRVEQGFAHVRDGVLPLGLLLAAGVVAGVAAWRAGERRGVAVPAAMALGWCGYVALVGGDIFPGWRQLSLAIVPLAWVIAEGAETLSRLPSRTRVSAALAWGVIVVASVRIQTRDSENIRAKRELWEWDGLPIGLALHRAFGDEAPLLAVDAAGALPYWSELPSLDMLGLNDAYLPRHPPPGFGSGAIGHELGDADYYLERAPDIIAFCGARGSPVPCFQAGRDLVRRPQFASLYQMINVQHTPGKGPIGALYVRRQGRIGLSRTADQLVIPGYLFAMGPAVAVLDDDDLVTLVAPGRPAELTGLELSPGTWTVASTPAASSYRLGIACNGVSARRVPGGSETVLSLEVPTRVDLRLGPGSGGAPALEEVRLSRNDSLRAGFRCSRRNAEVPLGELDRQVSIGDYWASPGNVVFRYGGLRVTLPRPMFPTNLAIVADANDRYAVSYHLGSKKVGASMAEMAAGSGMQRRELEVPHVVTQLGVDELRISAHGDRAYSVGRIELVE